MSFSNTQLAKNVIIIITNPQKIIKICHFKYAINKKTCHHNYFHDIINPQKIIKHDIFKYAISKKYVITFLYNVLIYDKFFNDSTR